VWHTTGKMGTGHDEQLPTVNGWTRPRNDAASTTYAAGVQRGLFKHIVYSPAYLEQGSCVAGNSANCSVYQAPDLAEEKRIGELTNKKDIGRVGTNKPALGVLTSPDMTSGDLIDPRLINDMAILESAQSYRGRTCAMQPTSIIDRHHLDDPRAAAPPTPVFARDAIRVSSRVQARQQCAYASAMKKGRVEVS
jgi:hypothetical protein